MKLGRLRHSSRPRGERRVRGRACVWRERTVIVTSSPSVSSSSCTLIASPRRHRLPGVASPVGQQTRPRLIRCHHVSGVFAMWGSRMRDPQQFLRAFQQWVLPTIVNHDRQCETANRNLPPWHLPILLLLACFLPFPSPST